MPVFRYAFLLSCLALVGTFTLLVGLPQSALAKSCGGLNQRACPILKKGPQCDRGLRKVRGVCVRAKSKPKPIRIIRPKPKKCGGLNEPACPLLKRGAPCKSGLANIRGICVRCGGLNQLACPPLKKGPQCQRGLIKINGRCIQCGGQNQRACPLLKKGTPCKPGLANIRGVCVRCGGLNQKACPPLKKGPQCQRGLTKIKGICVQCGGLNQRACPLLKKGSQCQRGLTNIGGKCLRCGGLNQRACPPLKRGAQCQRGLTKIKGICVQCGGLNQRACPLLKKGSQCQRGLTNIGGKCLRCGGLNQPACALLNRGAQCNPGLTNVRGTCRKLNCGGLNQAPCPKTVRLRGCNKGLGAFQGRCRQKSANPAFCGRRGQPACPITIRPFRCNRGLQSRGGVCQKAQVCGQPELPACPKSTGQAPCVDGYAPQPITNICKIAIVAGAQKTAIETGKRCFNDFKPMIKPMINFGACQKGLGKLKALKRAIKAKEAGDIRGIVEAAACRDELNALINTLKQKGFKSFSLGVGGEASAGVGVSAEFFVAMNLDRTGATLYEQVGASLGYQLGGSLNGVVSAFYDRAQNLSGGGKSFSVSLKVFGGGGGGVGLSKGKSPRCESFSATAGVGGLANTGNIALTQTFKLLRIPKPDFSPGCKNVTIRAINQTGREIKVVDIDFYDYKQDRWRSKVTKNETVRSGRTFRRTLKLQKVGGDQTRVKIQYRVRKKASGLGQWSKVFEQQTAAKVCTNSTTFAVGLSRR